ncbi:MAG: GNAT family N-acetyltransferase [Clostridiaceae bacterium]
MITKKEALNVLEKDKLNNVNSINFIESYPINYIEKSAESLVIKGVSDRPWVYITCKSEKELKLIKSRLNINDKNFAVIDNWMIPILTSGKKIKWILSVYRLFLSDEIILPVSSFSMSPLKEKDDCFIYESSDYKDFLSLEYVTERIKNGISSCIRNDNTPIAWGMTQDDGAIGFLHVLPEYRRKGYGKEIVLDLIQKVRKKGKIPFVHIEENNQKSMNLIKSLGFKKDKMVNWFEIE